MNDSQLTEDPGIGHNRPAETDATFDQLQARTNALVETANRWIAERPEIQTEDEATKAKDFKDQLAKQVIAIEAERKTAKQPWLDGGAAVDAKYNPLKRPVEIAKEVLRTLETVWLNKKQAILDEQRRQAEAKARAEREAAEKAAREAASERATIQQKAAAEEAVKRANEAARAAEVAGQQRARVGSAYGGRSTGLRTVWKVEIEDAAKIPAKHLRRLCAKPYVMEALVRAVKEDRDAYKDVPGIKIKEERVAA